MRSYNGFGWEKSLKETEQVVIEPADPYGMQAEIDTAKKKLNCCVTGCLGAVVLVGAIILGGIWYLYAGRDPVAPPNFMAKDARFMLVFHFDFDDEASAAFMTAMKDEFITSEKSTEKVLGALGHVSPGWIVTSSKSTPSSYSEPPADAVWAITYTHWWRVLDMAAEKLAGDDSKEIAVFADTTVYEKADENPPYFAIKENYVLMTWKLATMHTALDRLGTGKILPGPLAGPAAGLEWTADVTILSTETPGSLADYDISAVTDEPQVYVFELDLKSGTSARGRLLIVLDSESNAQAVSQALAELADEFAGRFGIQNTSLTVWGRRIEISFDFMFSDPKELFALMRKIFLP